MYSLTYTDARTTNQLLGNYRSFEEAKEGGERHFRQYPPGSPKWETNGIGAVAQHDGAKYEIRSFVR